MINKLKTYGGRAFHLIGKKVMYLRTIVATTDDKCASKLLKDSLWSIRYYWTEIKDVLEIAIVTTDPGVVYIKKDRKYIPLYH